MKRVLIAFTFFVAASAQAQIVTSTPAGIAVAREGRIEVFDRSATRKLWSVQGPERATRVIAGQQQLAVIDAMADEAWLVELSDGRAIRFTTAETPIDGLFIGRDFFVMARDAAVLERIAGDGRRASVAVSSDPAFIRHANGAIYVYSRLEGLVQEISPSRMTVTRRVQIAPFASDFETDGPNGYLLFPREARLRSFSLREMKRGGTTDAGAVPVDMTVLRGRSAMSAATLAIADPAAKRIWTTEGLQSVAGAFARGFVRGLLGLGLFAPRSSEFPTGVDQVVSRNSLSTAYDSSSGTLYRFRGRKTAVVAVNVAPAAFTLTEEGIAIWSGDRLRLVR